MLRRVVGLAGIRLMSETGESKKQGLDAFRRTGRNQWQQGTSPSRSAWSMSSGYSSRACAMRLAPRRWSSPAGRRWRCCGAIVSRPTSTSSYRTRPSSRSQSGERRNWNEQRHGSRRWGKRGQATAQEDWSKEQSRESHSQSRVATTSHGGGNRRPGCREPQSNAGPWRKC